VVAPLAAVTVDAAHGQEGEAVEFQGTFFDLGGVPPEAAETNVAVVRLTDKGLGGELHMKFEGSVEFSSSSSQVCFTFDVNLDQKPLAVRGSDNGDLTVDGTVDVRAGSPQAACKDVFTVGDQVEPGHLTATLTDTHVVGDLNVENADFRFSADSTAPTGSTGLNIGSLVFGKALNNEDLTAVFDASSCSKKEFDTNLLKNPRCKLVFDTAKKFNNELGNQFFSSDIRDELSNVAAFMALAKPDGDLLLPSLRYLMPVFTVMARKGDRGDQSALLALRRLIRLVVQLDLEAAK
jgi:hypothetical protein